MTEVTAGSGLYGPTLFDAYRAFTPRPAALFALPVVRRPDRAWSRRSAAATSPPAPPTRARLPRPHLPAGLRLDRQEGAGEVQTPLLGAAADGLALGDRVYMRHAKAGELCERFASLHLLEGERIVEEVPDLPRRGTMLPVSSAPDSSAGSGSSLASEPLETTLREVVETLAPIDRTPCSPGERQAAEWLAARLRAVAGVEVALEDEPSWGIFPPTATGLGLLGMAAAALVLRAPARRGRAARCGHASPASSTRPRTAHASCAVSCAAAARTVNLVARAGDREGATDTLVVLAHHDAPQTGMLFDQTLQQRLYERAAA